MPEALRLISKSLFKLTASAVGLLISVRLFMIIKFLVRADNLLQIKHSDEPPVDIADTA